jgi:hypothetical protein
MGTSFMEHRSYRTGDAAAVVRTIGPTGFNVVCAGRMRLLGASLKPRRKLRKLRYLSPPMAHVPGALGPGARQANPPLAADAVAMIRARARTMSRRRATRFAPSLPGLTRSARPIWRGHYRPSLTTWCGSSGKKNHLANAARYRAKNLGQEDHDRRIRKPHHRCRIRSGTRPAEAAAGA